MLKPYSLIDAAWLPVATEGGNREFVRLADISRPDLVALATGRPDCDISLTEFLIGLLAVACPPEDVTAWREGFSRVPTAAQLQAAFSPLNEALVLDGEGARFFQDRAELDGEGGPISGLLIDAPGVSTTKDNADHFVKRGRTELLSRAGAAIVLATLQTSSPSGGAGHRTSLRGGGPLTTLVVPGGNPEHSHRLWRLLWANVPLAPEERPDLKKVFPWLVPTRVSDKSGEATTLEDVDRLHAFFGMPRRIRLVFEANVDQRPCDLLGIVDDVVIKRYITRPWGTNYEGWSRGHRLSPYYKVKPTDAEFLPVHLKSSRVAYREWLGIAVGEEGDARVPAQCVFDFQRRLHGRRGDLATIRSDARLLVAGYAMDNMKPLDFGEALMPLVAGSTEDVNVFVKGIAKAMIDAAQEVASLIVTCVKIGLYGDGAKADSASTVLLPIRDRFWADTEQAFFDMLRTAHNRAETLVEGGGADAVRDATPEISAAIGADWLAVLGRQAERIFDDSVPLDSAESRRIGDIVKARRQLLVALAGYGAVGKRIFAALNLPDPAKSARKPKQDKGETGRKEGAA